VPYFAEVWTGLEYTLAQHQILAGHRDAGLVTVQLIRSRYDGARRNPFDEAECGHHYARAMASWGVWLAWTGFRYSAVTGQLALTLLEGDQPTFWSTGDAWGTAQLSPAGVTLDIREGALHLATICVNGDVRPLSNAGLCEGPRTITM